MVPVHVLGVAVDARMQPVVLLSPLDAGDGPRVIVPIWVGSQEAASISVAIDGDVPPRPLSHDLMARLLEATAATVDRVEVTRIEQGTFYAELALSTASGRTTLDCRPSDAIALSARLNAPLFVAESVLADAGVLEEAVEDLSEDDDLQDPQAAEERVAEFRRFLDDVEPEDFES